MEFLRFGLLGGLFLKVLLSFQLEVSFSDHGGILGLEVPNLPSDLSSDSDPVASGVEGKAVDGSTGVVGGSGLFDIAEIKDFDFLVFSTSDDEVSSGGDSDGVDTAIMNLDAILDVEGLVVPDFKIAVPSN